MSIRVEQNDTILVNQGETFMQNVMVYVTTAAEGASVDTGDFVMGSVLYVVSEGAAYMLDADGAAGIWRSVYDGTPLWGGES